jgi:hypothetical protein
MFTLIRSAIRASSRSRVQPAIAAAMIALCAGCDQNGGHNPAGSPVVRPDSDDGKKAIAQSESLLKLRQSQEAHARNRPKLSPETE